MASAAWRQLPHAARSSRAFSAGAAEEAATPIEVTIEKVSKPEVQQVYLDCAPLPPTLRVLLLSFGTVAPAVDAHPYPSC